MVISDPPLVSIITCTLNAGELLQQTIESIRQQRYKNYEYIVIDGGSTDSTLDVVDQYRDMITVFVSEPDSGIYDAWNKGLRLAKGKYFSFLGAGDRYMEDGLMHLVDCAIANPSAEYISARIVFIRDGSPYREVGSAWSWSQFRHHMSTAHAGALHSKTLFDKYGVFDTAFKIAGDYELLIRAGANLHANFVNEVTAEMVWGGISQINRRCFTETEAAKLKNNSVNKLVARLDRYIAELKGAIRIILKR